MNKIKFIYWFAYYNLDSTSVRYRAKYPLDFFKQYKSVESYFVIPSYSISGILLFLKAYLSALFFRRRDSLIVIQRVQSNFIYANLLKLLVRLRNKNTVYDLDDADYLEVNPKTIYYFAKHCEKISAGSKLIQTYLSKYNKQIIHTTSPIVDLKITKTNKNEIFTIGWIGGYGGDHKTGLMEFVFPAIKALAFPLKLIVIGITKLDDKDFILDFFQDNPNIKTEIPLEIDWDDEIDIQNRIVLFDVGIATLRNIEIQLSKSGIKAKQYLNNGVPVLSTNLPENNTVIIDGVNGYFCNTTTDFIDRLNQFYEMTDTEFMQFSNNARKLSSNFDHNKYFTDFEKIRNDITTTPTEKGGITRV